MDLVGALAEEGHVLGFPRDYREFKQTEGSPDLVSIGVNQASTFTGFCSTHDLSLFAPIELQPVEPTPEQAFLFFYRVLCLELFKKEGIVMRLERAGTLDRGLSPPEQVAFQGQRKGLIAGNRQGIEDLMAEKFIADEMLRRREFGSVGFAGAVLSGRPVVLAAGPNLPLNDFEGRKIQSLTSTNRLKGVAFTLTPLDDGALALFSWIEPNPAAAQLMASLARISDFRLPDAFLRYAQETCENTFVRPSWWRGLPERERRRAIARMLEHASLYTPPVDDLRDDGVQLMPSQVVRRIGLTSI